MVRRAAMLALAALAAALRAAAPLATSADTVQLLGGRARRRSRRASCCRSSSASTRHPRRSAARCRGPPRTRSCSPPTPATRCPTSASSATPGCRSSSRSTRSRRSTRCVAALERRRARRLFPGHLGYRTSSTAQLYGIPWYVDTRLLFYRARPAARRPASTRRRRPGPSGDEHGGDQARSRAGSLSRCCCRSTSSSRCSMLALQQAVRCCATAGATAIRSAGFRRALRLLHRAVRRGWAPRVTQHADLERLPRVRRGYFVDLHLRALEHRASSRSACRRICRTRG